MKSCISGCSESVVRIAITDAVYSSIEPISRNPGYVPATPVTTSTPPPTRNGRLVNTLNHDAFAPQTPGYGERGVIATRANCRLFPAYCLRLVCRTPTIFGFDAAETMAKPGLQRSANTVAYTRSWKSPKQASSLSLRSLRASQCGWCRHAPPPFAGAAPHAAMNSQADWRFPGRADRSMQRQGDSRWKCDA